MNAPVLGDQLYEIIITTEEALFGLGKYIQLAYESFEHTATKIKQSTEEKFTLKFPIGQHPSGKTMLGESKYDKDNLFQHYVHLAHIELPRTAIYHLVTFTETMFLDIIQAIVLSYPKNLGEDKQISISTVLDCDTIESIHLAAVNSFLNKLAYSDSKKFVEEVKRISGCNLLEIPAYHRYIEMKATRDIFIHNKGIANKTYIQKSGSHARVMAGELLPINLNYFLSAYESCIQIAEHLQDALHRKWHSPKYEASKEHKKNGENV